MSKRVAGNMTPHAIFNEHDEAWAAGRFKDLDRKKEKEFEKQIRHNKAVEELKRKRQQKQSVKVAHI